MTLPLRSLRSSRLGRPQCGRYLGSAKNVALAGACAMVMVLWTGSLAAGFMLPSAHTASRRDVALLSGLVFGLESQQNGARALMPDEIATINLFKRTSPSLLMISDRDSRGPGVVGAGFAWDQNHVVTTANMIKGIRRPSVTLVEKDSKGGEQAKIVNGALVGLDPMSDVAVLWVDAAMKPLRRGSSQNLLVGQDIYALGNPFGFEHSLSKGVVSGLSRTFVNQGGRPIEGIIQTDAAINPGNNGGPLLDGSGAVVGLNNAILSTTGTFGGVGLAMPIEAVERSVTSLITQGYIRGASMGVELANDALSQQLGVQDGVLVKSVASGSPAEVAGLRPMHGGFLGDIIYDIDTMPVNSVQSFFKALEGKIPGDKVTVSIHRAAEGENNDNFATEHLKVQLGARIM
eukprot:CAMPEP_0172657952 /NCGR_PEP_ID=MMETSP1074-20121228/2450_1 /TAXON_ID=2916 /ORGANISM="Ceratium fusus, Strain PA161109" /LENGTH=402 /DNA_ID=CAMNT_0013473159 /DNA_START=46 /DNA_END=1254 /DNA_ORIENTATION=-